ncbi:hypothetical protein [Nocardia sp. CY41]|uniref:hypothetical protein n=1 Tax=Nocardia sp. CY41 TaxID=2608686 RepID=UPI00135A71C9|nr:hypothetical protein [Nocardia sp. CY41]
MDIRNEARLLQRSEGSIDCAVSVHPAPGLGVGFIELETMVAESEPAEALEVVRSTLRQLGIADTDLTAEQYTDAVLATRRKPELP